MQSQNKQFLRLTSVPVLLRMIPNKYLLRLVDIRSQTISCKIMYLGSVCTHQLHGSENHLAT